MTSIHVNRPVHDAWIAQVRPRGCRRWQEVGRYTGYGLAAREAVSAATEAGMRFRVLADSLEPSYYDPHVVMEGVKR